MFKDIPGYEGRYQASMCGQIKSLLTNTVLKLQKGTKGYLTIRISSSPGNYKTKTVHRLVAKTWMGDSDLFINHIDGNKLNNHVDNLEYCTKSENGKHAYKLGLQKSLKGSGHGSAKLNEFDVNRIRKLYSTGLITQKELGNVFNLSTQAIQKIVTNKTWNHI